MTVPLIRKIFDQKQRMKRSEAEQARRAGQLFSDEKLRERYYEEINAEVNKLDADKEAFYALVNNKVQSIFEQAYLRRLNTIYERSKEAQSLEKRRMLIRFKKFLMRSRILTFMAEDVGRHER